jgi:uncharacterized lipoprotein YehR (DUF1307 family)
VLVLRGKNAIAEILSITAMGAEPKNPAANFTENKNLAMDSLTTGTYKGDRVAKQSASAIYRYNGGIAIVTAKCTKFAANVAAQVRTAAG